MVVIGTAADVLDSIRGYLWIVIAGAVVWRLFPVIKKRLESEDFTLEVAGQKVSFQSASRQLNEELADVRRKVIELTERLQIRRRRPWSRPESNSRLRDRHAFSGSTTVRRTTRS